MNVNFKDNSANILNKVARGKDRAIAYAAQDIEVYIKTSGKTPKDKGSLRGRTRHEKISDGRYRVVVPVVYAAYQERGSRADGTNVVKKYTTPGTGKGFFQAAIDITGRNFPNIIKSAFKAEGL